MATAAGLEIASELRDGLAGGRPGLAIVDCMLPAALAAAKATGTPAASLVHFLYGVARRHMAGQGGGWTTDLDTLRATYVALGLEPPESGLGAWEDCAPCWSARRAGSTPRSSIQPVLPTRDRLRSSARLGP